MANEVFNPAIFPLIPSFTELLRNKLNNYNNVWHLNDMQFEEGILRFDYQNYKTFTVLVVFKKEYLHTVDPLPYFIESITIEENTERGINYSYIWFCSSKLRLYFTFYF